MTFDLKEIEKRTIIQCIKWCNGNKTEAAKLLGLSYRGLRNKVTRYRDDNLLTREDKKALKKGLQKIIK